MRITVLRNVSHDTLTYVLAAPTLSHQSPFTCH